MFKFFKILKRVAKDIERLDRAIKNLNDQIYIEEELGMIEFNGLDKKPIVEMVPRYEKLSDEIFDLRQKTSTLEQDLFDLKNPNGIFKLDRIWIEGVFYTPSCFIDVESVLEQDDTYVNVAYVNKNIETKLPTYFKSLPEKMHFSENLLFVECNNDLYAFYLDSYEKIANPIPSKDIELNKKFLKDIVWGSWNNIWRNKQHLKVLKLL